MCLRENEYVFIRIVTYFYEKASVCEHADHDDKYTAVPMETQNVRSFPLTMHGRFNIIACVIHDDVCCTHFFSVP